jgi:hypothetical protein
MTAAAREDASNTLVASVVPPMPVSTTATSTFLSAKCLRGVEFKLAVTFAPTF